VGVVGSAKGTWSDMSTTGADLGKKCVLLNVREEKGKNRYEAGKIR